MLRITYKPASLAASSKVRMGSDVLRHRDVLQPELNVLTPKLLRKWWVMVLLRWLLFFFFFLTSACNRTFHFGSSKMTFLISAINSSPSPPPPSFTLSSIFFLLVLLFCCYCHFFPNLAANSEKSIFSHSLTQEYKLVLGFNQTQVSQYVSLGACSEKISPLWLCQPVHPLLLVQQGWQRVSGLGGADPCGRHAVSYSLLSILPACNSSRRPESARVHKNEDKQCWLVVVFFVCLFFS